MYMFSMQEMWKKCICHFDLFIFIVTKSTLSELYSLGFTLLESWNAFHANLKILVEHQTLLPT